MTPAEQQRLHRVERKVDRNFIAIVLVLGLLVLAVIANFVLLVTHI